MAQKSGEDQFLPMVPEFANWLKARFPLGQRQGKVFKLDGPQLHERMAVQDGWPPGLEDRRAGDVVANKAEGKFASRAPTFAADSARGGPPDIPLVLQLLMRHKVFESTRRRDSTAPTTRIRLLRTSRRDYVAVRRAVA